MTHPKKDPQQQLSSKERLILKRKEAKKLRSQKRGRLCVKNLPYTVTPENLKEHFAKFGEVTEVNLLKKSDGTLVGCGFIQFKLLQNARKAQHHLNGKEFLGRNIECCYALTKDTYSKKPVESQEPPIEIKDEPIDVDLDLSVVKDEIDDDIKIETNHQDILPNTEIKDENEIKDSNEIHEVDESDDESSIDATKEESEDEEDDLKQEQSDESESETKSVKKETSNTRKPRASDCHEGKTVFIKNVPFSATNDDFKECMSQFGPVIYAVICIDKLTEHSKGTGFAKFFNVADAEKCLQAGTELKLLDNILDCHKAVSKDDMRKNADKKKGSTEKDSRNLYLIKEGVILAGSAAAQGVSPGDMAKRLQLEQYKTQVLRNLNMFISKYRLIIHNIPPSWNNEKLKALFQKHSGRTAEIKECRIMRDFKNIGSNGIPISKEYGFVTFTTHEDTLNAIRILNNNPTIFTPTKRPIVAFSVENKVMVKAKIKRLERSKTNNPQSKEFVPVKNETDQKKRKRDNEDIVDTFRGVTAKPGIKRMRSRYKLQAQAKLHHENVKKEKHRKKFAKKTLQEKQKDFTKQPRQKINKSKKEVDGFSKLVNDYKKKLHNANLNVKKSKWYDQ